MRKYNASEVKNCYNLTAKQYAEGFLHELDGKPFDRNILDRFAAMLPAGSTIYDFGCGSGQTTKYLADKKLHRVTGLDFCENAIALAKVHFPEIGFAVDDMLHSKMPDASTDGIVAFYAIVHFTYTEVEQALKEWLRLLKPNGYSLFCFHVGDEAAPIIDFLGVKGADATWQMLDPDKVLEIAKKVGFVVTEAVVRYPYIGVEHESRRAYILLRKPS
jgi:ubiquinone/menaquinone biosynthesis C-methylase UbiE